MKRIWLIVSIAAVVVAGASYFTAGSGDAGGSSSPEGAKARATLKDADGLLVGSVKLEQDGDNVNLKVKVDSSMTAGFHGFHIHAAGFCDAPFTSALGHYNPGGAGHRDHAGDLPVLYIDGDGEAEVRVSTDRFALDDLFDANGSAFIIHAGADNYANIPARYASAPDATTVATGDAGARAACGIIERG